LVQRKFKQIPAGFLHSRFKEYIPKLVDQLNYKLYKSIRADKSLYWNIEAAGIIPSFPSLSRFRDVQANQLDVF
jgi:hypothetical protein